MTLNSAKDMKREKKKKREFVHTALPLCERQVILADGANRGVVIAWHKDHLITARSLDMDERYLCRETTNEADNDPTQ